MTRIKSNEQPLVNVKDWQHADQLIKEIGEIEQTIKAAEQQATADINVVKSDLEGRVEQLQGRSHLLVKSLEEFALAHTKDFGEARSRKLDFGILGWRLSTAIETAGTTLERIKQFFTPAKQKACIRVKESVDKEALAKFTDDELATVKARRKTKDAFFVEPLSTKAADHLN
ncbi:MAG: host-nuclease inhibitor Gam family protein [Sedimentisphaerales bacterium]|jgi:phage host-nuclease inhibitor protein Gam